MKPLLILLGLGLSASALAEVSYTYPGGRDPDTDYSPKGKPNDTINVNDDLPSDLLTRIYNMLPEGQKVNSDYVVSDEKSNIAFDAAADVRVTFLNEGAGYRNALGYFIFDSANPPTTQAEIAEHIIVFPNTSLPSQGQMQQGDQFDYDISVQAGQTLGFFVVPNGWGWSGDRGHIKDDGPWNQPFYSISGLNPEPTAIEKNHNVVFVDTNEELLVIGFEDMYYSQGDKDYNDLLFTVKATPFNAIAGINDNNSIDGDNYIALEPSDGGSGSLITTYYPSLNGNATLAFEDNWPYEGDFDYNDVVVRYQMTLTKSGSDHLKGVDIDAHVQAMGAGYHNALAWRIPNIGSDNIDSVSLTKNGQAVSHTITQMDGSDGVFVISEDVRTDVLGEDYTLSTLEPCGLFRTRTNCKKSENTRYQFSVTFKEPVLFTDTGNAPFDPFLFGATGWYHGELGYTTPPGRKWEVHLKSFCGSSEFDSTLLTQHDDNSDGSYCYLDNNNVPWAINIADNWDHPAEKQHVTRAYPLLQDWVTSGGTEHTDWYQRANANTNKLYEKE